MKFTMENPIPESIEIRFHKESDVVEMRFKPAPGFAEVMLRQKASQPGIGEKLESVLRGSYEAPMITAP